MPDQLTTLPVPVKSRVPEPAPVPELDKVVRGPRLAGLLLVLLFVAAFSLWGARAPLAGGAIAYGTVNPTGSVRLVQHLEGGIVAEIIAKEGERVVAGQPLVALDSVRPQADVNALNDRRRARLAERARLEAESLGLDEIDFPPELDASDATTRALIAAETGVFRTRRALLEARRRVLRQQITQLEKQIGGYRAQVEAADIRLELLVEEITDKASLFAKGLLPKAELLALKRAEAETRGFRGEYESTISSAHQRIGETELELLALDAEQAREIAARTTEVRSELAEIEQRLAASADVLGRTVLTAPTDGIVANLRFKTVGGVIRGGEPILEIVPVNERLVIEAHVKPVDIDLVRVGLDAVVHLLAFSGRTLPQVEGTVMSVDADSRVDQRTGERYYLARVEVPDEALTEIVGDAALMPGMPADVLIVTEERTLLNYLLEPITDTFRRSLREV